MGETMHSAIPAATLILMRDRAASAPEILMVGRGAHLKFAGGRLVFPGGRVDDDDHVLAARADLLVEGPAVDADDLAHRVAAIRESIEEIGLAPGIDGIGNAATIDEMRAALHDGEPFSAIMRRLALRLDPHGLHAFSRWRPDHEMVRRFDTRFYIARAPELGEAVADGTESSHCLWASAEEHLATGSLIFPTIRNLERIALSPNFDEAVAFSGRYPIDVISPQFEDRDGERWLSIPDNLGYPVTSQRLTEVQRGNAPSEGGRPERA